MTDTPVTTGDAASRSVLRRLGSAAIAVTAVALGVGLAIFVRADSTLEFALPARAAPSGDLQNVASAQFGPTVRASSAYAGTSNQHHPAYLVDGRRRPTLPEKWASRADDRAPWVEIVFARPVHLERVVITHGGAVEKAEYTADAYRLRCMHPDGTAGEWLRVEGNRLPKATHPLDCSQASGVRLELTPRAEADNIVRLYEVEAFGR